MTKKKSLVAIIMGSDSDWPIMKHAAEVLDDFNISYEAQVVSAHRTPDLMFKFAEEAEEKGFQVIIAGAGGSSSLTRNGSIKNYPASLRCSSSI